MHRLAKVATAALATIVVLAGCAATEQEERGPEGPNGYSFAAALDDGHELWWDRGSESGLTDLVLEDAAGARTNSCLGEGPLLCVAGLDDTYGVLVIAPEGAERAVMYWFGQEIELTRGAVPDAEAPPVFAGVMPAFEAGEGYRVEVFDANGDVIWP